MPADFDYDSAFSRNLSWLTPLEHQELRSKRIAIEGLGGVGGIYLLTLARLGIGKFSIAEFDTFDLVNFNRQAGATMSGLDRPKLDVMVEMVRDINPSVELRTCGVNQNNVDAFLQSVDVFVDGLDFSTSPPANWASVLCCDEDSAITMALLGMGAALLNFLPGGMSFADCFGFHSCPESEKPLRFLLGLAPAALHRRYLVDPSFVDLSLGRGPPTAMACQICAGIAATEEVKILLKRGDVVAAPFSLQFDAYRNRMVRIWRPGGYRNPLQRRVHRIARRQFARFANRSKS